MRGEPSFYQLGCGCVVQYLCCVCAGRSEHCYPYHFAEGRWRLYKQWKVGPDCTEKEHKRMHSFFGADGHVMIVPPSKPERELLVAMAMAGNDERLGRILDANPLRRPYVMDYQQYMDWRMDTRDQYDLSVELFADHDDDDDDYDGV
jgi:hypothetical protein